MLTPGLHAGVPEAEYRVDSELDQWARKMKMGQPRFPSRKQPKLEDADFPEIDDSDMGPLDDVEP